MRLPSRTALFVTMGLLVLAPSGIVRSLHAEAAGEAAPSEPAASTMTEQKLAAEIENLRAETESLRALRPFSREATAWLAAAGTIAGGLLGAFITYVINRMGQQRLRQERELAREQHNLQLFQHLGNGDLAAAAVLLDRLKRLQRLQQENHTDTLERAEIPLIKKVLISSLKKAQVPKVDRQEDVTAGSEAVEAPAGAKTPRVGPSTLRKFIADELVDTLSAKLPGGTGLPEKTGISPLGEGPEFQECDLSDIYWANVDARGLDFYGSDLSRASLRGAALQRAKFYDALMIRAVLEKADLTEANLTGARLEHANLQEAILKHANLQGADLTNADLTGADLSGAVYNTESLPQRCDPTRWPGPDFDPGPLGARVMNEVYRPGA